MALINDVTLKSEIKNKMLRRLYYICGDEEFLKTDALKKIRTAALSDDPDDYDNHEFDAREIDFETLRSAVYTFPMLGGFACITLSHIRIEKLNADEKKKLYEILCDIPDTTVIIITQLGELSWKEAVKKWPEFEELMKSGGVLEFHKISGAEIVPILIKKAQKSGCTLSSSTADYLIERCGNDLCNLQNEVEKLCCYIGQGEITKKTVDFITIKTVEAKTFDLTKHIIAGRADAAYGILRDLFFQKTEPLMILGAIIKYYSDLYRVTTTQKYGAKIGSLSGKFGYTDKIGGLLNMQKDAAVMSPKKLTKILAVLEEADSMLKSSPVSHEIILEVLLGKLLNI